MEIEQNIGINTVSFAYPNGNYSENVISTLMNNGFACAVTTKRKYLKKNISLFELPRIGVHEDISNTIPLFVYRLLV
jgi:hypothetical protein